MGTLTRYSASAGSGKTFRLASIYLSHLFSDPESYRRILAVTFTNKATSEMKSRILDQLHVLATGGESKYLAGISADTGKKEGEIRKRAGELLNSILHDYSRFSVSTIDAFFQKVIRAFARESGLHSGFSVELDHTLILAEAVDRMIASSADDKELRLWLNEFVNSRISEDKSWNPGGDIIKLAEELFREKYKILSEPEKDKLGDKKYLLGFIKKLKAVKETFEETLFRAGKECERLFSENHLTDDMFYYRGRGVPAFVHSLAGRRITGPNTYVYAALADPPRWAKGELPPGLRSAVEGGLERILRDAVGHYEENIIIYNSALEILSNVYSLGILSDVSKNVREIASSENSFLIADSGELLRELTSGDQAPFIYEKIGNRYDYYMIDEFQDTSRMQWDNFFPLIEESMGNGNDNLVVGDVKQSIYRFRNSEWQILGSLLNDQIPGDRLRNEPLRSNWRSRTNIIRFNNSLFRVLPAIIDSLFAGDPSPLSFRDIYAEAVQEDARNEEGGFVRIEFIDNDYEKHVSRSGREITKKTKDWEEKVLEKIPSVIEFFQDKGYRASDIGIIVRNSREGTSVLNAIISHSNNSSPERRSRYNYNVVSDYSLALSNSPAVTFMMSVLKVLNNPEDEVSLAAMVRFLLLAKGDPEAEKAPLFADLLRTGAHGLFPEGYKDFMIHAANLPLFEAVESMIDFFGLGKHPWNAAYLNTFQDLVLNFSSNKSIDIQAFIDWWETKGNQSSVIMPENQDAARIFTIHKAKGLEFRIVLMPFISWNDDHDTRHRQLIWVKPPDTEPFSDLGILPVRYRRDPPVTVFNDSLRQEKYSAYLDNLNLLYVAMTRAQDAIWGYAAAKPDTNEGISRLLLETLKSGNDLSAAGPGIKLSDYFDEQNGIFEFGEMQSVTQVPVQANVMVIPDYGVCRKPGSIRLRLRGENYLAGDNNDPVSRINYGKLMHRAFEYISVAGDIQESARRLVIEGEIPESESEGLISRLKDLISAPEVSDWFSPRARVLREADILLPSGEVRRPDRIVFYDNKISVIDLKFGEENPRYRGQVRNYCRLLTGMGYAGAEGFLWYVDRNRIEKV